MNQALTHLGDITIEQFLKEYWQKKPLLIRQAYPDFQSPLDGDELAGLSLEDEVESRLVLEHGKTPWEVEHGPFAEERFSQLPESHWSLLVQAVDQWVPEVHELLKDFRFIPSWRLDDIMVSYAPDQGSVGPHFDYYDVFLLQGAGKRRWRVGQMCNADSPRIPNIALNILSEFDQTEEWVLEPGDMLYLPPGVAHWGIAEGESITYSIGFRAPSHADILSELSQDIADSLSNDERYSDPDLQLQDNPGQLPPAAIAHLREILNQQLTDERIASWFGRYMSERKYVEELEFEPMDAEEWLAELEEGLLLWRHPAARFAWYELTPGRALLFVDGAQFPVSSDFARYLCESDEIDLASLSAWLDDENQTIITALINQESLLLDE